MDSYPVKFGFVDPADQTEGGPISSYEDGFTITGANAKGECYATNSDPLVSYGDPVVNFNEDMSYGCVVEKGITADDIEAKCADMQDKEIFKNLDKIEKFGQYGNADISFGKDWKDVKADDSYAELGKFTWDPAKKTCTGYNTAVIKVVYYTAGYSDLP